MAAAAATLPWGAARALEGVTTKTLGSLTTIHFTEACSTPVTISSDLPFRKNSGRSTFCVYLKEKNQRTAIGIQFGLTPKSTYLTPIHSPGLKSYLSFGGAGFIYPVTVSASRGYKEKDRVDIAIDWVELRVEFKVNSNVVSVVPLDPGVEIAWASLSSEGGGVVAEVSTEG
jgi:hypothetical protein